MIILQNVLPNVLYMMHVKLERVNWLKISIFASVSHIDEKLESHSLDPITCTSILQAFKVRQHVLISSVVLGLLDPTQ